MTARVAWFLLLVLLLPGLSPAQEPDSTAVVQPLAALDALIKAGSYREAEDRARELLAETEAEHGAESLEAAEALDRLVESLWRGGKAADPDTRELADRAIAVKERILGPDHADVARSLHNLSAVHWMLGEYASARPVAERVLAIRENTLGPDHPDVARSLNGMGLLLQKLGDYDAARATYERAVAICETALGPDHPDVGLPLVNLAGLLRRLGDHEAARPLLERSLVIRENALGPDHPDVASSLQDLAALLSELGDGGAARPLCERALAIRERALGPDHPNVASSLNGLGAVLWSLGDYEAARPLFERSLAILENAYGPAHPSVAGALNNLSLLHRVRGDDESALPLLERALAISEETHGRDHPGVLAPLTNLSSVLISLGEYEAAIPLAERALAIQENSFGPEHADVGGSLDNLAIAHWGLGDYDTALPLCERALAIKERALGPDHWEVGNTLNNLITVLAIQGETGEALDLALRAEGIGRERLRLTAQSVSEREALGYASARVSGRDFALTFAATLPVPGSSFKVWDSEIRSRAVVLDEMGRRHQSALAADAPELAALRDELSTARTRLAELVVRGPERGGSEAYGEECEAARLEKERAERGLAAESAQFRSQLELEQAGLKEVRDALPEGCALLAFSLYPHVGLYPADQPVLSYMAFLLPVGEQDPVAIRLGPAVSIDPLVGLWKEQAADGVAGPGSLAGQETRYRRAGEALRQVIWDPIAEHLGDARQVFIVPDGTVNLVSFQSLPVGEHEYLIEQDLRIHYLSAERDLLLSRREGPAGEGLLALGDPDFNTPPLPALAAEAPGLDLEDADTLDVTRGRRSGRRGFDLMRFAPLPATGAELDDLAAVWRTTSEDLFLRGAAADEAALKAHAPGKRVLHLTTHGFFLGEGQGNTENPLLLSGLVLAGANRRDEVPPGEEDGILTAEEVSALDLRGVEWAVLSACETGVGALEAGEGVLGLRRAFQVAGVGTVIMSLWEVEDEATREWMRALYRRRFEDHLSTAEAVRAAGLEVLNARRERGESTHPFFWGAFIAAGDWR